LRPLAVRLWDPPSSRAHRHRTPPLLQLWRHRLRLPRPRSHRSTRRPQWKPGRWAMAKPRPHQPGTRPPQRSRYRAIVALARLQAIQRCRRRLARRSSDEASPSPCTDLTQPIARRVARACASRDRECGGRERTNQHADNPVDSTVCARRQSCAGRVRGRIHPGSDANQRNGARRSDRSDSVPGRPDRRTCGGDAISRGTDHSAASDNARWARDVRRANEGPSRDRAGAGHAESLAASLTRIARSRFDRTEHKDAFRDNN
jgi:hypothetical protein